MLTPISFFYVRHGQTDWNLERRCQGHTDIPLNETGIAQAHDAKARLVGIDIGTICCSPLGRARHTAEIVNMVLQRDIVVIEDLKESGFGEREGDLTGQWHLDWQQGATPRGAEVYRDFVERSIAGVNQALEQPGPILIVGHGGVYRSLVRFAGLNGVENLPNCLPLHHTPPQDPSGRWMVSELADNGTTTSRPD